MNLNQSFSILFWLNKSKANKQGLVPIWVRITVDGKRAETSVQRQILPEHWDAENNKAKSDCPEAKMLNQFLIQVNADISKHYNILLITKEYVTAEDVKKNYKGIKEEKKTFFQLFDQFLQHLLERAEADDISQKRYERFITLKSKCASFIKLKFHRSDILLEETKLSFITEFEHHLRIVEKIGHNTAMKYAKDLKQVTKYAVTLEYIPTNHLANFKCTFKKTKRKYLDQEEIDVLMQKKFSIKRLEEVRDCYIFSCYTGYAYTEIKSLTPDNVTIGFDGGKWIIRDRQKTDSVENVPLLDIPLQIIEKYKNHPYCKAKNQLLPVKSNQRYNGYLKEIADICGITKNLTTHTARHTCATTVLLTNDVPLETVKEILGHTDIRTTQIYGKIVQKKISNDMSLLKTKLQKENRLEKNLIQEQSFG